jgi:ribonuclease BN (tRNA processing enzyme)
LTQTTARWSFSRDTGKNPNLIKLAKGADVLVHEMIDKTWPQSLVLSHLVPGNRPDSVWEACGKGFDGQLIIGHDLDVIGVGTAT